MEKQQTIPAVKRCRKNERGAALVTVLMISMLLVVAAAALLMEASMNTANVSDATAEEQAYYAAESGIQSVVNVLRGNTVLPTSPVDLRIDTTKVATDPANQIDYVKAANIATSNRTGDSSTEIRMSRWLSYGSGDFSDRVILGDTSPSTYTKYNGLAFKVTIRNPDNADNNISYTTTGRIDNLGTTGGDLAIQYLPVTATDVSVASGTANTNFGKFKVTGSGTIQSRVRFAITINMTKPYIASKVMRGYIEPGTLSTTSSTVNLLYDSQKFIMLGSEITLTGGTVINPPTSTETSPRFGYQVPLRAPQAIPQPTNGVLLGETLIAATITPPEPKRLLITSTGFGPRGSQKQLEAVIYKNYFDSLAAPSPLLLIGPPNAVFNAGTATNTTYSGIDVQKYANLPPIGVTNDTNLTIINTGLRNQSSGGSFKGQLWGTVSNVQDELPEWLRSPRNLEETIIELRKVAEASGRFFGTGGAPLPGTGGYGTFASAKGITFVNGNLEFSGDGGGILVVTGDLKFQGGFRWNGLMVILGANGISRTGGGGGTLQGNMIVAPYDRTGLTDTNPLPPASASYLAPKYDISGGGNSDITYNSNNVDAGLDALSNFVKGVAEK